MRIYHRLDKCQNLHKYIFKCVCLCEKLFIAIENKHERLWHINVDKRFIHIYISM